MDGKNKTGISDLSDRGVKLTVRIPAKLYQKIEREVEEKNYPSISAYVRRCLERGL